ncbi:MAG: hypothetical protein IJK64_02210 [Clostridia bacterium]|nr:hypothetical protein [Clostridia bacterium]
MKHLCKKMIACLLATLMLCAALPLAAYADGADDNELLYWYDYIERIDIAEGCNPSAVAKKIDYYYILSYRDYPSSYVITLLSGDQITIKAEDIYYNYEGHCFDVVISDTVTLTFNAWILYHDDLGGAAITLYQLMEGETPEDKNRIIVWTKEIYTLYEDSDEIMAYLWSNYIYDINFVNDNYPHVTTELVNGDLVITDWYFPDEYEIVLLSGESFIINVDNDVRDPFDGQWFTVDIDDSVSLYFNLYITCEDVVTFWMDQFIPFKDSDYGSYKPVWSMPNDAPIDNGSFFARLANWFRDLFQNIREFFAILFGGF